MATEEREIRLVQNEDGWWTAVDGETGVASQGESREAALKNLDEAVELSRGRGDLIEDEETLLRELGIDPSAVESDNELPEFMQ